MTEPWPSENGRRTRGFSLALKKLSDLCQDRIRTNIEYSKVASDPIRCTLIRRKRAALNTCHKVQAVPYFLRPALWRGRPSEVDSSLDWPIKYNRSYTSTRAVNTTPKVPSFGTSFGRLLFDITSSPRKETCDLTTVSSLISTLSLLFKKNFVVVVLRGSSCSVEWNVCNFGLPPPTFVNYGCFNEGLYCLAMATSRQDFYFLTKEVTKRCFLYDLRWVEPEKYSTR